MNIEKNKIAKSTKKATKRKQKSKEKMNKKELKTDFCIMPKSTKYSTIRTKKYNERHEVFFSRAYRNKSIKDGLIVFLTEEDHRGTNGVHGKKRRQVEQIFKKNSTKGVDELLQ